MKFLLLLFVLFSFIDARIYRDNSKEIVIDDTAKLMWNDDTSVVKILKKQTNQLARLGRQTLPPFTILHSEL